MAVPPDLIELGVVRGAYGVKGWVRIEPFAAEATMLQDSRQWWLKKDSAVTPLTVIATKRHASELLAKWEGLDSREAAQALKGAKLAVARSEFPEPAPGEFYWVDLIGASVINRAGVKLGTVQRLFNNGAQDVLEVQLNAALSVAQAGTGKTVWVPMVETYIDRVDTAAREVHVDWEADW